VVEVEYEEEVSLLKGYDLVSLMSQSNELVITGQPLELVFQFIHCFVKCFECSISQLLVVTDAPLSSAVMVTESIALSGEINPLWMAKLIPHEVQVCFSTKTHGEKSDHLVESHSSVHSDSQWVFLAHVSVDLLVKQPHGYCFVSHYCLVM
jgi:hypothetical protein